MANRCLFISPVSSLTLHTWDVGLQLYWHSYSSLVCYLFSHLPAFETLLPSFFLLIYLISICWYSIQSLYLPGSFNKYLSPHINTYTQTDTHANSLHICHFIYNTGLILAACFPISTNRLCTDWPIAWLIIEYIFFQWIDSLLTNLLELSYTCI